MVEKVVMVPGKPFRPELPKLLESEGDPDILGLIEACWAEEPADRPDMAAVLRHLKKINKGR